MRAFVILKKWAHLMHRLLNFQIILFFVHPSPTYLDTIVKQVPQSISNLILPCLRHPWTLYCDYVRLRSTLQLDWVNFLGIWTSPTTTRVVDRLPFQIRFKRWKPDRFTPNKSHLSKPLIWQHKPFYI